MVRLNGAFLNVGLSPAWGLLSNLNFWNYETECNKRADCKSVGKRIQK
jgi:hypothetical protein